MRCFALLPALALVASAFLLGCDEVTEPPADSRSNETGISFPDNQDALRAAVVKADAGGRVFVLFEGKPDRGMAEAAGATVDYEYRIIPALAVRAPGQVISQLARHSRVVRVEPDVQVELAGTRLSALPDVAAELAAVWGVQRIGAGLVHEGGRLGSGVKVGVLDTGCDYNHPDIFPVFKGGHDFVNDDNDPMDDAGHGTHVSGTIAAVRNGVGVVGVAPDVELYCLKMLNSGGNGNFTDAVAAMDWAISNGVQVTNHSYSSSRNPGTASRQAFDNAEAAGMISVAAAGNGGNPSGKGNTVAYPARFETVVAVAAIDASAERASFSATGGAVELAAPGVLINSTVPGGGWATNSGTSMASPHVAGVVALLIAADVVEPNQVRAHLQSTAEDLGAGGRDNLYGYGLVRADEAVLGVVGNTAPTASFTFSCDGLTCQFDASGSSDSDGTIDDYAWNFGDGASSNGSSPTTSHTYTAPGGTFTVELTVTDNGEATDSDVKSVQVGDGGTPANGPAIAFVSVTSSGSFSNELMVMDSDGSNPVVLLQDNADGFFFPSFSPEVVTTSGFTGRIAYELWVQAAGQEADLKVVDFTIDPTGSVSSEVNDLVLRSEGGGMMAAWSPDGHWLAYVKGVQVPAGIWVMDYSSGVPGPATQLIADPFPGDGSQDAAWPTWSPDGKRLAFTWCEPLSPDDCADRIRIVDLDYTAGRPIVKAGSEVDVGLGVFGWALDWSRGGNYLAFKSGSAMRTLDVNGVNVIRSLPVTTYSDSPTWPAQGEAQLIYMNRRGKAGSGKRRIVSFDLATEVETVLYQRKGKHLYEPDWRRTP